MDLKEALSREVFRPLVTLVAPGATLIAPYLWVVIHFNPDLVQFWQGNAGSVLTILFVFTLAAGLVLEDLGARIESHWWDLLIDSHNKVHLETWRSYLTTAYDPTKEPIGQHYIRSLVLRMKFELGFSLALLLSWPGWLWLHLLTDRFSNCSLAVLSAALFGAGGWVLRESYGSSQTLGEVRHLLVHGSLPPDGRRPEAK